MYLAGPFGSQCRLLGRAGDQALQQVAGCGILLKYIAIPGRSRMQEKITTPRGKKTYAKPEVRFERVFETMALSCGKIDATQSSCTFNRKTS